MTYLPELLLMALGLTYAASQFRRWLRRRAAFRAFASAHGLRFRATIPSDKYVPYALFTRVASEVLLYHVVEGRFDAFDIAVFDLPRRGGSRTAAIVSGLPVADAPEPPQDNDLLSFYMRDGHLLGVRPAVRIEDLPAFVEYMISAARCVIDGAPVLPPPR